MHRHAELSSLACALTLVACSGGEPHHNGDETPPPPEQVALYTIDTDQGMAQDPGNGAGVFVEYQSGGGWYVYVTCDSNRSGGTPCYWDIQVDLLGGSFAGLAAATLDSNDYLASEGPGPRLVAETTSEVDGFTFAADRGATVRFDVLLDGRAGNGYVLWVSGGAVNTGSATNPVDFKPSTP
jgi:hypothetical protein